jgi:type IV secretory pathway TraG/TraD family ATPase VirD4
MPHSAPPLHHALSTAISTTRAHGGGCYLGDSAGPRFSPSEHGVLVLGPPRSGKTSSIVTPNVLGADGPVVAISTKPDVFEATYRARLIVGQVSLLDPSGSIDPPPGVRRVGWSPVTSAGKWDRAVLCADAMVNASRGSARRGESAHWNERASALLAPLLHAAAIGGATMSDVVRAINRRDVSDFVAVLSRRDAGIALDVIVGIVETDDRERSGIFSTASSVLAAYRSDGALASTEIAPIDFDELSSGRDTCFVLGTGEQQRAVAPIVAGFVGDLRHGVYARHRTPADRSVLLVLDELANIAPLEELPSLIAEGGSQGIVTLACLQDLSQARARWGPAADGFLSLFGTKVVLPGIGDRQTLEALSLLSGDRDIETVSLSGARRRRARTWTRSTRSERRIPPDLIANGPEGSAIVVSGARLEKITLTPAHRSWPFAPLVGDSMSNGPIASSIGRTERSSRFARSARARTDSRPFIE